MARSVRNRKNRQRRRSTELDAIFRELETRYMPPSGYCDDPYCDDCNVARGQLAAAFDAAKRAYDAAPRRDRGFDEERHYQRGYQAAMKNLASQREQIFESGYQRALVAAQEERRYAASETREQIRIAQQQAYHAGLAQGQAAGYRRGMQQAASTTPAPVDVASLRRKMVNEMLDQCKIISESNPNMAPGVNAVRHRIKKLSKEDK